MMKARKTALAGVSRSPASRGKGGCREILAAKGGKQLRAGAPKAAAGFGAGGPEGDGAGMRALASCQARCCRFLRGPEGDGAGMRALARDGEKSEKLGALGGA
jgi:hypothetical protein